MHYYRNGDPKGCFKSLNLEKKFLEYNIFLQFLKLKHTMYTFIYNEVFKSEVYNWKNINVSKISSAITKIKTELA